RRICTTLWPSPHLNLYSCTRRPPRSPLFPYTTLFRSRIAERAAAHGIDVWIDMEQHPLVDATLELYHAVRAAYTRGCCSMSIQTDRKSTRLNSSHVKISYAVFCLKKKRKRKHC